ncbi:MAG: hypothetical protein K2Y23_01590 [Cyanobacteria bacterium]|nr:hypothetical protein [Cyanobacteriota bacterium]
MLPDSMRRLFWDIDTRTFDPKAFPRYTIERILEYGDPPAVEWLRSSFPRDAIASAVRTSRRLSPRSATFWALILDLPQSQVRALQQVP